MTKQKHTPGPWKHSKGKRKSYIGHKLHMLQSITARNANTTITIATVWPHNQTANTTLIAAAPDMLTALEVVTAMLSLCELGAQPKGRAVGEAIKSAETAIAKAQGDPE